MYLFCWFELLVFEILNFIKGIIMGFKNFEFEAWIEVFQKPKPSGDFIGFLGLDPPPPVFK